ncbi:MAG TPA: hypothetical protein VLY04_01520 [Bryobacteraceae bacterium]|nr:hypothetical protein [Bryobacteraceae bacterium]
MSMFRIAYGERGLLVADADLAEATGVLAARCKYAQRQGAGRRG